MILGLGVDLVEVVRFERALSRHGEAFLEEFLGPAEVDWCRHSRDPHLSCSILFAAKEAFFKALGTGRSGPLRWQDLRVRLDGRGGGMIEATGEAGRRLEARNIRRARVCVSMRRAAGLALALVLLEG